MTQARAPQPRGAQAPYGPERRSPSCWASRWSPAPTSRRTRSETRSRTSPSSQSRGSTWSSPRTRSSRRSFGVQAPTLPRARRERGSRASTASPAAQGRARRARPSGRRRRGRRDDGRARRSSIADRGDALRPDRRRRRPRSGRGPGEATVLEQNAEDNGLEVGDEIGAGHAPRRAAADRGRDFERSARAARRSAAPPSSACTRPQLQRLFDLEGRVSSVSVIAEPGVDPADLADAGRRRSCPSRSRAQTAERERRRERRPRSTTRSASFLTPALLALAGAAVLVGAFIIFNTFSITVAQRTREFAMLRALGATRRQILRVVALEALLIGVGRLRLRARGRHWALAGSSTPCSTRSGSASRGPAWSSRPARSRSRSRSGSASRCSPRCSRRSGRRASPRSSAMSSGAPRAPRRRAGDRARRWRELFCSLGAVLDRPGAVRVGSGLGAARRRSRAGPSALFIGIAFLARYLVRPLAAVDRLADRAALRHARAPRSRERRTQPWPNRDRPRRP